DEVPEATAAEVDAAVASAAEAFGAWRRVDAAERAGHLRALADAAEAAATELVALLTREQGKPTLEAQGELRHFLGGLRYYAEAATKVRGTYQELPSQFGPAYGLVVRRPIGVVGAITPWNFPLTLLGNKLGPALAAGNTVVAKPAETTPLTTLRLAELLHAGGLPAGVVNVVTGTGPVAGDALVRHPRVRKVAFTGSTAVGRRTMAAAAEHLKRVTLELGGSDPMIICDDADLDRAVSAASVGRFFNCGQACLATKRLFVFERVADEVVERLVAKASRLRVGPGTAEGVQMGPLHSARQRALIEEQVADAVDRGATVLCGGARPQGDVYDRGFFYQPTLLLEPPPGARVAVEETFGPVLPIWRVGGLDEAIERANDSPYGLGSAIWTRDLHRASLAAERLEAGYTWVNSINKVYDELPFGGLKQSGYGKEHGIEALDYYQETKSVVVRH
ncbi:MAG TPA: aldehyde dehydrogenase family protein, partial [Actinomycetes bacterium]|nr:aldehyde dehydrogenase family protein [Actinomycetes bacterium]